MFLKEKNVRKFKKVLHWSVPHRPVAMFHPPRRRTTERLAALRWRHDHLSDQLDWQLDSLFVLKPSFGIDTDTTTTENESEWTISSWFNSPTDPHDRQASVLNGSQCHRFALARAAPETCLKGPCGMHQDDMDTVTQNLRKETILPYIRKLSHDMKQSTVKNKRAGHGNIPAQSGLPGLPLWELLKSIHGKNANKSWNDKTPRASTFSISWFLLAVERESGKLVLAAMPFGLRHGRVVSMLDLWTRMSIQPISIWMDIGLDAEMVCTKAGMPVESSLEFYFLCTPMQIPCNFNKKHPVLTIRSSRQETA